MDEDERFPEPVRRRSARTLSILLALLGVVLAAGAFLVARGSLGIAFVEAVLAALAFVAAALEWTRARMAEAFALGVTAPAFMTAPVLLVWSHWAFGVAQGVLALACALTLAWRYIVRDEARHRPGLKDKAA